jgi:signal transduction histidine kinase
MKLAGELEPGVLQTFRLFVGVQLLVSSAGMILHLLPQFQAPSEIILHFRLIASSTGIVTQLMVIGLVSGPLFLYLSIPALRRMLKSYYLPIAILWAIAGPIFAPYIELHSLGNNAPQLFLQSALWQQAILLFIPLIVVSWQYSSRYVIVFCALTTGLNIFLLLSEIVPIEADVLRPLMGIVFMQMLAFILVGHMLANLVKVQREQRQSLKEANARLAQYASTMEQLTTSRERNRLARELHDILAHTLSGVAVELEGLRAMLGRDPEQASLLLNHALQAIREGLTETRRALQELRAKPLEDLGLALALKSLVESVADRAGARIELTVEDNLGDFPIEVEQCIYRIAQEALTNIADHAQAKNVQVTLMRESAQIKLSIGDDGCGFDPSTLDKEHKYGLRGMRERAEMVGGKLYIESQVGLGTKIVFFYGVSR